MDSCHSLDELAHVLAECLATRPLALAVSVEWVRGCVFLVGRAESDQKKTKGLIRTTYLSDLK